MEASMRRVLFAWELGANLGHLARLQPLAERFKARGHPVLVAVRETPGASMLFGPCGIPFLQAPRLTQEIRLAHRPGCYADILLSQGCGNAVVLRDLVKAWRAVFESFRPDLVVLDHSPTALLAARSVGIATALVGNGFELPPSTAPLPPFPGYSWATLEAAARSEAVALANANTVLRGFEAPELDALSRLFDGGLRIFATFPELDHYGARADVRYTGPLVAWTGVEQVDWPAGSGKRIFACLRPSTKSVEAILGGLRQSGASVICFAPGFAKGNLESFGDPSMRFVSSPVDLKPLLETADACVSYGAEGTVASFLLAGVPQLLSPKTAEAQMAARRIEEMGAGLVLHGAQTAQGVAMMLERVVGDGRCKAQARVFAESHRDFDPKRAADEVVDLLRACPTLRS